MSPSVSWSRFSFAAEGRVKEATEHNQSLIETGLLI